MPVSLTHRHNDVQISTAVAARTRHPIRMSKQNEIFLRIHIVIVSLVEFLHLFLISSTYFTEKRFSLNSLLLFLYVALLDVYFRRRNVLLFHIISRLTFLRFSFF